MKEGLGSVRCRVDNSIALRIRQHVVTMATRSEFELLLRIAQDITSALPKQSQEQRLVEAVHAAIPQSDAVALLRLHGDELVPIAVHGLGPELLGQRFRRAEHPRLDAICGSEGPLRFPADCTLPDPFDGFVTGPSSLTGTVHSCLGCPLRIEGRLVGVLTLDAIEPRALDRLDSVFVDVIAAWTAAALRTGDLLAALERQSQIKGQIARELVRDALVQQGGLLVGPSEAMIRLRSEIDQVASADFPVLVTGETGTGKELVVRTLHAQSQRKDQPLIQVNCAALPESVAESELFGHTKGAFTGATSVRLGKFQAADGASLFLDEIGELPLHLQPKLLRVLQTGEVQSIGSDSLRRVDVRVFAATNRDLEAEVRAGRFRADLLYRLDVCRLRLPPLRARLDDVLPLAGHACDRIRRQLGTGRVRLRACAQSRLLAYEWPGNVRELENVLARAVLRASARREPGGQVEISAEDLGIEPSRTEPMPHEAKFAAVRTAAVPVPLRTSVLDYERTLVQSALCECDGNWAQAAARLGMHRSNLHHLAKRLGLR